MLKHGQDRFGTGILAVEDYTMRNAMLHVYTLGGALGVVALLLPAGHWAVTSASPLCHPSVTRAVTLLSPYCHPAVTLLSP
jgi:hypothetical protein